MEKNLMNLMANPKTTENGAYALNFTYDAIVDLFAVAGALRNRTEHDIITLWEKAYDENHELALKMLFYIRNVRGGLGERRTFRTLLEYIAHKCPQFVIDNIENICYYGRFDDLFILLDTPAEKDMIAFIKKQLDDDIENMKNGKYISLLAKWMPSINTSSAKTRKLADKLANLLHMSIGTYRKTLSSLRKYNKVTEVYMSAQEWDKINYASVTSNALNKYSDAFLRHDHSRYTEYLEAVKSGKATINSSVLYPYDLVRKVFYHTNETAELQWKNLPDYFDGRTFNALVMADISGSMTVHNNAQAMMTSVGLAIYFAEHNTGAFANSYMTFSEKPRIMTINENDSLYQKVYDVRSRGVGYNTNLKAAFELVLDTAIQHKLLQEQLPESIIVISDMEIDDFGQNTTFLSYMETKFTDAGYKLPKLVWWNVNARNNTFHAEATDNVQFISGSSTSAFDSLISGKTLSPIELVLQTLSAYDRVIVDAA